MGISYKPFHHLLIEKNLKMKEVMERAKISPPTIVKLSRNDYVGLRVIEKLCGVLDCKPEQIFEIVIGHDTVTPIKKRIPKEQPSPSSKIPDITKKEKH
ncbi:helix-turn-helix domain-containing protein [Leadbettera azotonutricia]|uniref:HTH cro/C1-type domain-containing protein n=1 Tax=Leadbettera azotonutricia (strain ATCC BAA-888 / DSM 13862 / ZAS-9) TaxID=545695 RepID=F5YDL8_LEAAZ|nr:helix-turn-helix transcriptional regulator [Leadbettera azotonutricia]AEF80239.1 conserved hypothetical protein [Leadbettera azotonutricia ZAS-9]